MGNKVQGSKKVSSRVKAAGVKDRLSGVWDCRPPLPLQRDFQRQGGVGWSCVELGQAAQPTVKPAEKS